MTTHTKFTDTSHYLGVCQHCDRPYRVNLPERHSQFAIISCPGCGQSDLRVERLVAVTTTETCDPRCMGAYGPSCECSCGGANHGAGWDSTATEYELESAISAYRVRQERTERQRRQRQERKAAKQAEVFQSWLDEGNQDVVDYLTSDADFGPFLSDMADLVAQRKPLTERQAAAVRRNIERDAKQAQYEAATVPAPLGKGLTIEGTVISVKPQKTYHTYHGEVTMKMTIECGGYRVWGSVPRSLIDNTTSSTGYSDLKGQRVQLIANVEPTKRNDDPSFAVYKRPRQAKLKTDSPYMEHTSMTDRVLIDFACSHLNMPI